MMRLDVRVTKQSIEQITDGRVVARHSAVGTSIVQVVQIGAYLIVREDYYHFPRGRSNVYCIDAHMRQLWEAELPSTSDVYANPIVVCGEDEFSVASWEGCTCWIDATTGKIRRSEFTK